MSETEAPGSISEQTNNQSGLRKYVVPRTITLNNPDVGRKGISRRNFLTGVVAAGAVAAVFGTGSLISSRKSREPEKQSAEPIFSPTEDPFITKNLQTDGFQPEAVEQLIADENLPPEIYGILAAAGVSVYTKVKGEKENDYYIGSGGVAVYKGEYFLVATTHVFAIALKNSQAELSFAIPGTQSVYRCRPRTIYSFCHGASVERDEPMFIKIEPPLKEEIDKLKSGGKINPLKPRQFNTDPSESNGLFRFQGSNVGLHPLKFEYKDEGDVDRYRMVIASGKTVGCVGCSGSPVLRLNNGKPTGEFTGVVTHNAGINFGKEVERGPDPHRILDECSIALNLTSFGISNFATGLKSKPI